ncbi:MAG: hypothetical protein A3J76_00490 [Candidatus Moranbacteria bacterium RBG_13_45_13]|nr:MAG: hypothetical protein A3J76_00490 [Candidatus Moranbacteria bacterium RBG_13_45_13]
MKKNAADIDERVYLVLPIALAIFFGILADKFIFRCDESYCTAILFAMSYVILAAAWMRDAILEWQFRMAIRKELNSVFGFMAVGKGLATRLVVTVK